MIKMISHAELLRLVDYDRETGIITRKVRTSNRVHVGDIVGFPDANGYLQANIGGVRAYVHQFVWLYVHGVWPDHDIDHRNRDTQNNTISNLRRATASENLANKKRPSNNTSGFKGVHPKRSKWCSQIRCGGQRITLGVFETPELAHAAYCDAAKRLFGEFARAA
ncbi:HNH endonuclease [Bradyrhizobium sp. 17]|uniref:HNH endonuclease n=1 Tax=Bradyrhizobium sp. 17 TaxID=2782649 RepID=UPI001FFA5F97|nr:HNH endonuclease [Bradyrhizobium sp. 17]MCK1520226.1 HNH endonuclease [Bradyrhizobium sp. 17]